MYRRRCFVLGEGLCTQGDAELLVRLFVLLRFGAGTRFPAFGAASPYGRGCKDTESGVETEPTPAALRLCSHELKLIGWMDSEQQRTCTGVGVS